MGSYKYSEVQLAPTSDPLFSAAKITRNGEINPRIMRNGESKVQDASVKCIQYCVQILRVQMKPCYVSKVFLVKSPVDDKSINSLEGKTIKHYYFFLILQFIKFIRISFPSFRPLFEQPFYHNFGD